MTDKGSEERKVRRAKGQTESEWRGQRIWSIGVAHHTSAKTRRSRLARESARLDPRLEQTLAEEGIDEELATWPGY